MRAKLYVLAGLVLLSAAGAAWAYTVTDRATEAPAPTGAGCCVTGDCCCPGQGACCDLTKRATPEVAKMLTKAEGCCGTGNCCCPGASSCCAGATESKAPDGYVCPLTGETLGCKGCCPLSQDK